MKLAFHVRNPVVPLSMVMRDSNKVSRNKLSMLSHLHWMAVVCNVRLSSPLPHFYHTEFSLTQRHQVAFIIRL